MQKSWPSAISKIPRKSRRQLYVYPPSSHALHFLFSSFRTGAQSKYIVYNRGYAKKTTPTNSKKRNAWYVVGIWPQRPALRLFVATVFVTNVGKVFAPFYHYSIWNPPPSGYFDVKIKEGGSLDIVCMGHKCGKVVGPSIIKKIVNEDTYKKFTDFFLMSYGSLLPILLPLCHSSNIFLVVEHPNVKYCPAPGCKNAIISESANELVVPCEFSPPTSIYIYISFVNLEKYIRWLWISILFCLQRGESCTLRLRTSMTMIKKINSPIKLIPPPKMKLWFKKCQDDSETYKYVTPSSLANPVFLVGTQY